jgi:hypothetical protein
MTDINVGKFVKEATEMYGRDHGASGTSRFRAEKPGAVSATETDPGGVAFAQGGRTSYKSPGAPAGLFRELVVRAS